MQLDRFLRKLSFVLVFPAMTFVAGTGFAQTTFSCPANQYVSTQLVNTGQGCTGLPPVVTNVTGAASGGLVVSTSNPTSTPVVSVAPDATHYLPTVTDQTNWNAKQGGGNYVTALTGDVTAAGPGVVTATVTKINGGVIGSTGALQKTNGSAQLVNAVGGTDYALPSQIPYAVNPVAGASAQYPMLDGAGTVVTDVSGNGNHGSFGTGSASPTWYSYGVALLDTGSNISPVQYITTPLTSWKTAVVAYCTPAMVQTTGISTGGVPANNFPALVGPLSGANGGLSWLGVNASQPTSNTFTPSIFVWGVNNNATIAPDGAGGCHVEAVTLDTVDHLFLDGTEIASYAAQGSTAASVGLSSGTYLIGQGIRGVVGYAIFYPTARTSAEVQSLSEFVQSQVRRRTSFPKYPYMTNSRAAQAVFVGDSLTAGYLGSAAWTGALALNKSYNVTNYGVGGMSAYDMCKMTDQRWVQSIVPGQTTVTLWGGTNDIAQFGRSAQDVWTSIASCVAKAHSYGARVIVSTMIDRAGNDANKNAVNALIRSGCPQIGCDYVNDVAEVAAVGADGASATTACFQDGVHLTGPGAGTCATVNGVALSGYGLVGALASNALNTLDGSTQAAPDVSASNAFVETYANNYVVQTPTAAATHKLVDLSGQTSARVIVNGSATFSITVTTSGSQTIQGVAVIPPGATGTFVPVLTSATAGGGFWSSQLAPGSGAGAVHQANGTALASQTTVNYRTGTGNGGVVVTNPGTGNVDYNLSLPVTVGGAAFTTGVASGVFNNDAVCFSNTTGAVKACSAGNGAPGLLSGQQTWSQANTFLKPIVAGGAAPTMAAGAGAGTAPTCTTIIGFNQAGVINCTTGTATAVGTLATITFSGGALTAAPQVCTLTPRNAASAQVSGSVFTTAPSTTAWTVGTAAALTASTAYSWGFVCM